MPPRVRPSAQFRCLWFGMGSVDKWKEVERLRQMIQRRPELSRWQMYTVSNHREADIVWNLETTWETIPEYDAVVIPTADTKQAKSKSANRVTQTMALGVPVLADPLPEYRAVIRSGRNGFLCATIDDWAGALKSLEDPAKWRQIAGTGYRFSKRYFSVETIGDVWIRLFQTLSKQATSTEVPVAAEVTRELKLSFLILAYERLAAQCSSRELRSRYAERMAALCLPSASSMENT